MERLKILYHVLSEATGDGWCVLDPSGAVIHCNPAFGTLTGSDPDVATGVDVVQLLASHRLTIVDKGGKVVLADKVDALVDRESLYLAEFGKTHGAPVRVFRISESSSVSFAMLISAEGSERSVSSIGPGSDSTEPSQEEMHRLKSALDVVDEAVFVVGRDGRPVFANARARDMVELGQHSGTVEGIPVMRTTDRELLMPGMLADVLVEGETIAIAHNAVLATPGGEDRAIELTGTPIRRDDAVCGAIVTIRDVSILRRTEDELRRAQHIESVASLAGGIAHDFNNVLTAVLGNINLAKIGCDCEDEQRHALEDAEEAAAEARGLTQQLLVFSHGGVPVRESASIAEIVSDSAGFVVRGSNVKCCFTTAEAPWPVRIDRDQISQVIQNLVLNSKEAMPEGGIISITLQNRHFSQRKDDIPSGRYVAISIKDEGFGIPRKNLSRVLEPYYTTKPDGSGLGLAVAYSIVKNHDGYLQISSEPGEGTTAVVYLPALQRKHEVKLPTQTGRLHLGKRVLVMDDEALIRSVLTKMLRRLGCRSSAAENGNEAVYLYQRAFDSGHPFDLVILDLTVPGGMGGKDALARIKEMDPGAKVLVSSGYSNDPVMSDFQQFGFEDVITKPYSLADLSAVLDRVFP